MFKNISKGQKTLKYKLSWKFSEVQNMIQLGVFEKYFQMLEILFIIRYFWVFIFSGKKLKCNEF